MNQLVYKQLAVGHGDAAILQWQAANRDTFTLLIDGGISIGKCVIQDALNEAGVDKIDLAVLTHTDSDHVNGLLALVEENNVSISEYWGPYLPAFERYSWLFPKRVKGGLDKARKIENLLKDRGTRILYPVDGFQKEADSGYFKVQVISPAPRLIERLLLSDDALELFTSPNSQLGWLLDDDGADFTQESRDIRFALEKGYLRPGEARALPGRPDNKTKQAVSELSKTDPNFFGNSILNNTSIVILIDAQIGEKPYRLLFTGDLENFTYLAGKYPLGLACDIVKAPHHGSWSYIESATNASPDKAMDEVWQWLRPRAVLVSAKGKHRLPRPQFRDSCTRYGASLFCTNQRRKEVLFEKEVNSLGPLPSCFETFNCGQSEQETVTLLFSEDGVDASKQACKSGANLGVVPIIQMRQHIIHPSPIVDKLTEGELTKHVSWLKKELKNYHKARMNAGPGNWSNETLTHEDLKSWALEQKRYAFVPSINHVVRRTRYKGALWMNDEYNSSYYYQPNETDIKEIWNKLTSKFDFYEVHCPPDTSLNLDEMLRRAELEWYQDFVFEHFAFPKDVFKFGIWPLLSKKIKSLKNVYAGGIKVYQHSSVYKSHRLVGSFRNLELDKMRELFLNDAPSSNYRPSDFWNSFASNVAGSIHNHGEYSDSATGIRHYPRMSAEYERANEALENEFLPNSLVKLL